MFFWTMLALFAAVGTPVETRHLRCHGGAQIFFPAGSATLDVAGETMLRQFAARTRTDGPAGFVRIESGGDGTGDSFDRELSRRRSETIRDRLVTDGLVARETVIAVGEELNHANMPADMAQMGWVANRIRAEDHARLYPPDMIVECF